MPESTFLQNISGRLLNCSSLYFANCFVTVQLPILQVCTVRKLINCHQLLLYSSLKPFYCWLSLFISQIIITTLHKKSSFPLRIFFSKCNQIRSFLRIWLHLLKKSLIENFIFCAVGDFPYFDCLKTFENVFRLRL